MIKTRALYAAVSLLALLAISVTVGWALDDKEMNKVVPRVQLARSGIGGFSPDQLRDAIVELDANYKAADIRMGNSSQNFTINAHDIDLRVDHEATFHDAISAGRNGNVVADIAEWTRSLFRPTRVNVHVAYDRDKLSRLLERYDASDHREAVEPGLKVKDGRLVTTDGADGHGINVDTVIGKLESAADKGLPFHLDVTSETVHPRFTQDDAERLAAAAEQRVVQALQLRSVTTTKEIPPEAVRSWLTTKAGLDELELSVDTEAMTRDLESLFPEMRVEPVEPTWNVIEHIPSLVSGTNGEACCAAATIAAIADELLHRQISSPSTTPVHVEPKAVQPRMPTASEKIVESIGSFTTYHAAGQPRVTNIHLIADMVRGHVIAPGETFSLNDFVGPRTTEKGFVVDHVIENGKFAEAVGGGISQFATTTFNAAFFAGLDFGKYQSHSIYISRYPYGREATVSFPAPDLQLRNTTPYPVMIWTSHTNTSITVELFSTRYASGTQTGQTTRPSGKCTLVKTQRTRTYVDGHTAVDEVVARYQPGEGKRC